MARGHCHATRSPCTSIEAIDAKQNVRGPPELLPFAGRPIFAAGLSAEAMGMDMCHRISSFREQLPVEDGPKLFRASLSPSFLIASDELANGRPIRQRGQGSRSSLGNTFLHCRRTCALHEQSGFGLISHGRATSQLCIERVVVLVKCLTSLPASFCVWFRLARDA